MINEINLLYMVVLIWCCVFKRLFSRKKYWYWILILQYFLDTDTASVFFQIEYWYWYFSILKACWILVLLFCTGQCSGSNWSKPFKQKTWLVSEFCPTVYVRGYMFVLEGSKSVDKILRCLLSGHGSIKKNECQVEYVQSI